MNYLSLLNQHLKDDDMLDLLETYDVDVIYEYDRTHENRPDENRPDEYRAEIKELGLQLVFDGNQELKHFFIYVIEYEGYTPACLEGSDITLFESKKAIQSFSKRKNIPVTEGRAELFGIDRDWIRLEYIGHHIHYEYREEILGMITISRPKQD